MKNPLEPPDSYHLEAAQGWLGLGDWISANRELDEIKVEFWTRPAVLRVRFQVSAAANQWVMAAEMARALTIFNPDSPFGWIDWAYALYELNRINEARDVLLRVVDRFPNEYLVRYSLACYACHLGNFKEALDWLHKAIAIADMKDVRQMVLNNPDLQPLWDEMERI